MKQALVLGAMVWVQVIFVPDFVATAEEPSMGSAVVLLSQQARPPRPRPAARPRQPVRQPSARATERSVSAGAFTRAELRRMQDVERTADRLVERTRAALEGDKKSERLVARLEQEYGLTFVRIAGRHTLVRYRELIGVNLGDQDQRILNDLGFRLFRLSRLSAIGLDVYLLRIPEGILTKDALGKLQEAGVGGFLDFNTVFLPAGRGNAADTEAKNSIAKPQAWRVGIVDTGVLETHKALKRNVIQQRNFGRGREATPRDHGTAVASILASHGAASLLVADVFSGPILFADAEAIALALNWMAESGVGVINMSLAGPESPLLEFAVKRLTEAGHGVVAAVGNNGAGGEGLYPASYDSVLGVTAVNEKFEIFKHAHQGSAVDYAAIGVKLKAASLRGRKRYSGTSFAAPAVAAFLAARHSAPDAANLQAALDALNNSVQDYGSPGRDPVFGIGILP